MARRILLVLLVGVLAVTGAALTPATGALAAPASASAATVPGGLTPDGKVLRTDGAGHVHAVEAVGSCEQSDVTCKPDRNGSCTGYSSQSTPPTTIRVLTGADEESIKTVPFEQYIEDVLPNEWLASWDGDALKAGAVAIKSYAWYWVTHYGGYVGESATSSSCFDVTDDPDFQVYKANTGSTNSRIVNLVQQVRPVAVRRDGQIQQTEYRNYLTEAGENEACGAGAGSDDGPGYLSQYGSQACNEVNDANNGYRYNVILRLYYGDDIELSTTAQLRTQHDFTFTSRSTGGTWTASRWYIADGYPTSFRFGLSGDLPFTATDGDGFALAAVWRPSNKTFYLADALHNVASTVPFGLAGDVPVAAHYQGLDAATQLAVWRPGNGTWYLAGPSGGTVSTTQYGLNGDIPVPGRWLSATTDSFAVWRPSSGNWYIRNGGATVQWGLRGDIPAPADYNGDGKTDIAVYRPGNNTFYVRGANPVGWGLKGDVPVSGDFNGDGRADFAVYRPSNGIIYVNGQASINASKGTPIGLAPVRG